LPKESADQVQERRLQVERFHRSGLLIRWDCEVADEAVVDPVKWRALSREEKTNVAVTLSAECENSHDQQRMTIMDNESGDVVAEVTGESAWVR